MKSITRFYVLLFCGILWATFVFGAEKPTRKQIGSLNKTAVNEYKFLDANRINCTIASDGPYADYRRTNSSGLEWPRGSGKTAVYTAGIWLGAVHRPSQKIRISNMDYTSEWQPGPVEGTFNTTTNAAGNHVANSTDGRYRLYKINKSDTVRNSSGAFTTTNQDFLEWPGDLGAPYEDRNGNGRWDRGIDMPKFYGDQQMWCVVNDITPAAHSNLSVSDPLGMELQITYFCFNQKGPLGNMMFMRWKLINKSDADYDSVFIGMWNDPDLGDGNDDLPGCDTLLSLGYVYNGKAVDAIYGAAPPALGYDFFQGPSVPGAPTDSAITEGRWTRGKKNLGASSFVVYTNSTFAQLQDPPDKGADYILQAYDYLNGKCGTIHQALMSGSRVIKFFFSGDPVAQTGDLPSNFPLGNFAPQDVRFMISSGPFTMAKGDTQEIVGGIVIGQGTTYIESVKILKQVDLIAQDAFNSNFNIPSSPPMPPMSVSELPNAIILDWSENPTATESYKNKAYHFEGYKIYQTNDPSSGNWTNIWTSDVKNDVGTILDWVTNQTDGKDYLQPLVVAPDTGLGHYFIIDRDFLNNTSLIQGRKYYFAFSTYARDTVANALDLKLAMVLESPLVPLEGRIGRGYVTPIGPAAGTNIPTSINQTFTHDRVGDDALAIRIVDPLQLDGSSYRVTFNGTGVNVTGWNVIRNGTDTLGRDITDFAGKYNRTFDGVRLELMNPVTGPRRDTQTPQGYSYNPSGNFWFASAGNTMDAMSNTLVYPRAGMFTFSKGTKVTPDSLKKIEIRFGNGNSQRAFRFGTNLRKSSFSPVLPPADSSFLPFMKRRKAGIPFQDIVTVPFTIWEVDRNDGNATPRQLNVAFVENNDTLYMNDSARTYLGRGNMDGKWNPTYGANGGNEYLYIFASTYNASDSVTYVKSRAKPTTDSLDLQAEQDSLDIMYIIHAKATSSTRRTWTDGDVLTIIPNYVLDATRQYNFTTIAPTVNDPTLMKTQLEKINVFPNPYFAHNSAEPSTLNRYVTFSHLPTQAKIRIFTLNGELVRTLNHVDETGTMARTYERWDLRNENGLPVASGMYIAYVEIAGVGNKVLKLAIIQPEERATRL